MKLQKLVLICSIIIFINFSFVYVLFYYQTILSSINIENNGYFPVILNNRGDTFIFWQVKNEEPFLRFYNIENNQYADYPILIKQRIMYREDLDISLDDNYIFFTVKEDNLTTKYYFDTITKKTGHFADLYNINGYFRFNSGNSTFNKLGIGREYVLFTASNKEAQIAELVVYSLKEKRIIDTISSGGVATLSPSEESFVYIKLVEGGRAFSVYEYDFDGKTSRKLYENLKDYVHGINWSPDGKSIAVSYEVKREGETEPDYEVSIINLNGNKFNIGERTNFIHPVWLDNDNIIFSKYENRGKISKYKVMSSRCMYNISNNKIFKITDRFIHENCFFSLDKKSLFFNEGEKLQKINIEEMRNPNLLNRIRARLGVIKL